MKKWYIFYILISLLLMVGCSDSEKEELTVSIAASMADAMEQVKEDFEVEHGQIEIIYNVGSSGALQQQIAQGAPVDLFLSASEEEFNNLVEQGMIEQNYSTILLQNELVLIKSVENNAISSIDDLQKNEVNKIAIGTPETVPAGAYAKEALQHLRLFEEIENKLIPAKDVRQVLYYVETNNVDVGFVYDTDVISSDKIEIVERLDPDSHTPILYPIGIIKDTDQSDAAVTFYNYLQTESVSQIFEEYGFNPVVNTND
ncbi:molybdate ABC transporter substrate-binding protein [Aquibacillus koreensis]|uniref:Molybdate ABC transporter substrate-binding protein n=1 Tax=Aquibacillus koreensis TaxID=279446 RepID=A0A9X3WQ84_9BACI|nr:molybdate ABC transporter substrate-binding protein [Aquibacillus koreensis]MCT2536804.1 molybdate ABC transporter substrate-binding protein [Aquibacillus koreensis]MDC3421439.1 molybdate ABC transporter substrate-binding protein [Aquibacillus koreensis]